MPTRSIRVENVAQAFLELLRERGIDCLFGNSSTSVIDGLAKFAAEGKRTPRPVMLPHEYPAVAMAHGYYLATGRPQAAILYSTVGTANALGAIINASRARIPVLVAAARSSLTEDGSLRGARDIHVQWAQESFDQAGMVREYVKWDYELRQPVQLETVIDRALELALDEPRGPVYLALPRDVMAQPLKHIRLASPSRRQGAGRRFADPAQIEAAAQVLARAHRPLVITSEAGRDPAAVAGLVELADAGAMQVIEASPVYANFPASHPGHAGYVFGSQLHPDICRADAILVVESDVPWFPSRVRLREQTRVVQLGVDPFFSRYPTRNFRCDVAIAAAPAVALPQLAEAVRRRVKAKDVKARRAALESRYRRMRAAWARAASAERSRRPIGFQWAARCIGEVLGPDTIVVNEYPLDLRHAPPPASGTYFGPSHAGGLGWGFGAALGVKLGAPERTVIATLGDGSYLFSVPTACHFAARKHDLPVLTVVFNNSSWDEVKKSTSSIHPGGWAASGQDFPMSDLSPAPHYEQIVRAFDGYGERVEAPSELPAALRRALRAVRKERRQALLNVVCRR